MCGGASRESEVVAGVCVCDKEGAQVRQQGVGQPELSRSGLHSERACSASSLPWGQAVGKVTVI